MSKKRKQHASQWSISHTCDTLRRYQRPSLYARIMQREFPQNGETVAAKCPIHKSLRWMLCWSLGGPFFQRPNPTLCPWNCCLKVESSKQLKWTPSTLRNICRFPNKKGWWVARVFIFNMVQYWCAFHFLMLLWTWNQWHRLPHYMHCTCSKAISSQVKLGRS